MTVRPLEENFGGLLGGARTAVRPTQVMGAAGTRIYGGFIIETEADGELTDRERYRTFSKILANCSIAAAGIRYFTNLIAKADWNFTPTDHPESVRLSEMAEQMLMEDPATNWKRVVRRACMYRFYGFSFQEWTARRREDGFMTFADIAPRPQITIERWDVNTDGSLNGVVQRNPQNQREIYLPRGKLIYLVDDTLNDSPQGLGLFRHIVQPARRLARYEQLEGFGFETDLRGIPIIYAPYAELRQQLNNNTITVEQFNAAVRPLEEFARKHIKNPELSLILDSDIYVTTDGAQRPSNQQKYRVELLEGGSESREEIAEAIERINREIARIIGVESILLGEGDAGSHALSRDKTNQFSLVVDSTLGEIADSVMSDLLSVLWSLNGWPVEAMPQAQPEAVQYRDIEQIASVLRDMAQAGAVLAPDDPAIDEVRALAGLPPMDDLPNAEDAALSDRTPEDTPDDPEEELPDTE